MTLGDRIRSMNDYEMAEFLEWDVPDSCSNPETGIDYECFNYGCRNTCPHGRRTKNMLKWVQNEWQG